MDATRRLAEVGQAVTRTLAVIALVVITPHVVSANDDLVKRIDALAQPLVDNEYVVGMSIGVAVGDTVVFRGYGRMGSDDARVPDERTVYEIGSISKTFTGVLLADASLRGEVKLDDPVALHLSDNVKIPQRGDKRITLAQLATHTSGLPRMPSNFAPADPKNPYADYTPMHMFAFLAGHELRRDPGAKREYSNLAVGLLGHTLARRADTTYEQLMIDRIARPLGMNDTTIALSEDQKNRLASPHNADGDPDSNWDIPTLAGAGAIRSTVADMIRYTRAHAEARDVKEAPRIDPRRSSVTPAIRLAMVRRFEDGNSGMGLGWHTASHGTIHWHNGQTGGYHSYAAVVSQKQVSVVVLTNTATGVVDRLGERIGLVAVGGDLKPLKLQKAVAVPAAKLQRCVGRYQLPMLAITVTRQGDRLYAQATGQPRVRVYPKSETSFAYRVVDAQLTFRFNEAGVATGLTLHQHGLNIPGARIDKGSP